MQQESSKKPLQTLAVSKVSNENTQELHAIKILIVDHYKALGIDNRLPEELTALKIEIRRFHQVVCEDNSAWPIGFDNVRIYHAFFKAVRDGRMNMNNNLSPFAHAMAFKDWTKSGSLNRFKPQHKALMAPQSQSMSLTEQVKNLRSTISFCQSNGYQLLPEDNIRRKSYENAIKELDAIQYQQGGVKYVI